MNKENTSNFTDLGIQISRWRRSQRKTQAELEKLAGLSHNTVSRIETGIVSPRLSTCEKIAQVLGISFEQLQFEKPDLPEGVTLRHELDLLEQRLKNVEVTA